jgi:hypothetical protein
MLNSLYIGLPLLVAAVLWLRQKRFMEQAQLELNPARHRAPLEAA